MKHSYIHFAVITILSLILGSCQKSFLDPVINTDPNNPTKVTPPTLLASSEGLLAYASGGTYSWFSSILDQQTTGANNQFTPYSTYNFATSDFDNMWTDSYQYNMGTLVTLKQQADQAKEPYYAGIARVLFAYQMSLTTDMWGDVPYSQAFNGKGGNLNPVFDKQADIYTSLQKVLDTAKLQLSGSGGAVIPGSDDNIYQGDVTKWLKAANVLKARLYLHLSKVDPANYQRALDAITSGGFASNADDLTFTFGATQTNASPNYQLSTQRAGYMDYGGNLPALMSAKNDPRLPVYVSGYDPAANTGSLGSFFSSIGSPVYLITYSEQNFILSEAYLQTGNIAAAQKAYTAAVSASLEKVGVSARDEATYLAANSTLPATGALAQIITQKYFALYLNPEAYTDWRRTGYPVLKPNTGSAIPRRFLYPLQELQYNGKNVPAGTNLFTHVFWDK